MKSLLLILVTVFISNITLSQVRYSFITNQKSLEEKEYDFKWLDKVNYSDGVFKSESLKLTPSSNNLNRSRNFSVTRQNWVGQTQKNVYYLNKIPIESTYEFNTQGDFVGSSFEIKLDKR
ncbi:MAG: hypothetical protein AAF363_09340 [Bacteroidota bacterium]